VARPTAVEVAGVRISSPDDVLYPEQGITKRELAAYYDAVAPRILPELKGRPLTLVRCPDGEGEACFYQRHAAERGPFAALRRVALGEANAPGEEFLVVPGRRALLSLVQMRVLSTSGTRVPTGRTAPTG
jgi:bifunctional non-homologous end joining protein LigD